MGGIHIGGSLGKVLGNVGSAVKKAASDTVHEVARHPAIYGTLAAPLLGPVGGAVLAGAKHIPGVSSVISGAQHVYDALGDTDAAKKAREIRDGITRPGGPGKLPMSQVTGGDKGGGPLDWLKDNALPLGVGLLGAKQVGDERQAADDLVNRGLDTAHKAYADKEGLRAMALSQLTSPSLTPNLSGRFDTGATNPYAKKIAMSSLVPNRAAAQGGTSPASGIASNLLRASDVGGAGSSGAMANRLSLSSLSKPSPGLAIGSRVPAKLLTSGAY